ncbi:MAG: cyclic nucleotide-binding domain-containing protein [Nostoc sp. DedSLP03]|uniref:cyclic nucleotide-binding domain-containing protein n=1 Tax=Nostoc sp. DedSLP03 TaxID=3075400 RepID=UPI002AD22E25|nr:cyclic nucleotide-binding domain-containing protein [Nostoc sp. DedSLP03]MDZ7963828.1 cyclic nucleotide-binding domain-containing protein [Nostoc sp. DedSLP03]
MTNDKTVVSIQNLNYFFGEGELQKQVLSDINLEVKAKEFVILTGPSGSGKSTLLSLIGCLRSVRQGSLNILGQELNGASREQLVQMRRNFGYITQSSNLLDFLTVQQNIQISLELQPDFSPKEARAKTAAILEAVGLAEKLNAYPANLSGGQKQRVAIASALVTRPKLVLADEPTASLDKIAGRNVVALMHRLAKEQSSAVLIVTHDNRILDLADRIVNVEDGKLGLAFNQELSLVLPGFDEALLEKATTKPIVLTYESEQVIVHQGEPADKFYILLEGKVEIIQELPDEPPRLINHLSRGDYFGEVGLLRDGKRTATVRVARNSEVKVMVIEEELFRLFLGNSELTKADIVRHLHQRVMTSHLSNALPNVDPSEIIAVAAQAKVIRYGANSILVKEGEVADKFYLILEGEVEALMSDRHDKFTSSKLKPGEYFGNAQLVNGENYPFTVRAGLTEVEVMVIDRESFCSLIFKSNTNQDIVASVLRHRLMNF